RLADVAAATPEAIAGAGARVKQLTTLVGELEAAGPKLAALAADKSAAAEAIERAADELAALTEVVVPDGVGKLHDQVTKAAAALEQATAAVGAGEKLLAKAGDLAELTLWADAHGRAETLTERREKGKKLVAERENDVAAAKK